MCIKIKLIHRKQIFFYAQVVFSRNTYTYRFLWINYPHWTEVRNMNNAKSLFATCLEALKEDIALNNIDLWISVLEPLALEDGVLYFWLQIFS